MTAPMMTAEEITALLTRDGRFLCARWSRPVAPVLFGLADEQLPIFRTAIAAVLQDAGVPLTDTDPESGANLITFLMRDWAELAEVPDLDKLTGIPGLPERLMREATPDPSAEGISRYQLFRFDAAGAIRACICLLRLPDPDHAPHPAALAESLAVNAMLTFSREVSPNPALAALIRAAYDPVLPACATDSSHALRLQARMIATQTGQ